MAPKQQTTISRYGAVSYTHLFTTLAVSHLDDKDRMKEYLTKILASGNHLLSLINDILDMSRIESGKIQMCIRDRLRIVQLRS